jgi:hypothetical protein
MLYMLEQRRRDIDQIKGRDPDAASGSQYVFEPVSAAAGRWPDLLFGAASVRPHTLGIGLRMCTHVLLLRSEQQLIF